MIGREETLRALLGSWRLILGDARAMGLFDTSIEGFWRSFAAVVVCLPMPLVELAAQRRLPMAAQAGPEAFQGPAYWLVGLVAYGLTWVAYPVLLAALARPLGIAAVYVPLMVARNWTTVIASMPSFVFTLLFLLGLLPITALGPLNLAALGFGLYCSWVATRLSARTPPGLTGGLVALDFVVSLVVYTAADRLVGI